MLEGLVPFGLAKDWISRLYSELAGIAKTRKDELRRLTDDFGNPEELAKYYVEPDCQQFNPADDNEDEGPIVLRLPLLTTIEEYISNQKNHGKRQLFLLSDAGMGKSSALLMLKLSHMTAFWPRGYGCELLKLGQNTLAQITKLPAKPDTVLLLDALDEDPLAWDEIQGRIKSLLAATEAFKRVIITCRTQFFSGGTDPFNRRGQVEVGGYLCPVLYNSLFSDSQVKTYLEKRAKAQAASQEWIGRSLKIINAMGSLRMRPMLLSHIDDFVESEQKDWNNYTIYQTLVAAWLLREKRKIHGSGQGYPTLDVLRRACHVIAVAMHLRGARTLDQTNLKSLMTRHSETKNIQFMHIGGRSLLNKDSLGNYRFSHYSIQEFLVADAVFSGTVQIDIAKFRSTDVMRNLFAAWIAQALPQERLAANVAALGLDRASFSGMNLDGLKFAGMNLEGTNFSGASLREADFSGTSLIGAIFHRANLEGANLTRCDATGADFSESIMTGARTNGAIFRQADFRDADLLGVLYDWKTLWSSNVLIATRGGVFQRGDEADV